MEAQNNLDPNAAPSTAFWSTSTWSSEAVRAGTLNADEEQILDFSLPPGTYLELEVEGSVTIAVLGPSHEQAHIYPSRGATRQLLWIEPMEAPLGTDGASATSAEEVGAQDSDADHALRLTAIASGPYQLHVKASRPATPEDYSRRRAYRSYVEARELSASRDPEKLEHAVQIYADSVEAWKVIGEDPGLASTWHNLGSALVQLNRHDEALAAYRQALEAWRRAGHQPGQIDTHRALGTALYQSGEHQLALDHLRQALALAPKTRQALALHQSLGAVYRRLGQPREALDHLGLAQQIASRPESGISTQARVPLLNSVAMLYLDLGEAQRAVEPLETARELAVQSEDRALEAAVVNNLASTDWALGDTQKALQRYETSLALHTELGDVVGQAQARNNLGWVLMHRGDFDAARQAFETTLERAQEDHRVGLAGIALDNLAKVDLAQGRLDAALERLHRALPLRRAAFDRPGEARTLANLARVEQQRGAPEAALERVTSALEILESLRSDVPDPDLRSTYFADHRQVYELNVDLLVELHRRQPAAGYDRRAFEAAERARARSLLELLSESRIDVAAGIDPQLKSEERRLGEALSSIQQDLMSLRSERGDTRPVDPRALETRWRETREELERLERRIRLQHPRYADLQYPQPPSLEQVQSLLPPGTALLEYSLGDSASHLFAITRSSFEVVTLAPAQDIASLVRPARAGFEIPSRRGLLPALSAAHALYQELVAPVLPTLHQQGVDHLLISPDQVLHYLAFEALLTDSPKGTRNLSAESWLLRDFAISYAPSASVLVSLQSAERSLPDPLNTGQRPALVAFADPVYPPSSPEASTFANLPSGEPQRRTAPEDPALQLPGAGGWTPAALPDSRAEARGIAEIFPADSTLLFLADEAREETVKNDPRVLQAQRLHFATHAVTSHRLPRYSGLVLSLPGSAGEDGLLQVYEIFNLRIQADLVTLSACETGLGREVGGEGLLGLTQAFLYAGAPNLVVSLWRVADRSTAELMVDFYRKQSHPTQGTIEATGEATDAGRLAHALRDAKLTLLRNPALAHPFHWAPFILVGRAPSTARSPILDEAAPPHSKSTQADPAHPEPARPESAHPELVHLEAAPPATTTVLAPTAASLGARR